MGLPRNNVLKVSLICLAKHSIQTLRKWCHHSSTRTSSLWTLSIHFVFTRVVKRIEIMINVIVLNKAALLLGADTIISLAVCTAASSGKPLGGRHVCCCSDRIFSLHRWRKNLILPVVTSNTHYNTENTRTLSISRTEDRYKTNNNCRTKSKLFTLLAIESYENKKKSQIYFWVRTTANRRVIKKSKETLRPDADHIHTPTRASTTEITATIP